MRPNIMVVIEGRVRVESKDGELIDELRSGDMVGEISFLDGKPRTANVVSGGKAKIMVIPAARLKDLMRKNPRLESTIYKNAALALCERLREANQQVEAMSVSR